MRIWKRRRYSATLKTKLIEFSGRDYAVRELTVAERIAFIDFANANDKSAMLVYAWLLSVACEEFVGDDISDLSMGVGPSALEFLAKEIMEISGMGDGAVEESEKKSESGRS